MKTIGIFVDIHNQFSQIKKKLSDRKLDYQKLLDKLRDDGTLYCAIAYGQQKNDEATPFIDRLEAIGYEVKYKQLDDFFKTEWFVGMALDVANILDRLDIVMLVTSHPEMIPVVRYVRERGRKCIVIGCGIYRGLKDVASSYIEIDEDYLENPKTT